MTDTLMQHDSTDGGEHIRRLDISTMSRSALDELRWVVRVIISSGDRFYWDNGFSRAASLAYTSLLSLIPLAAMCFAIVGAFMDTGQNLQEIQQFIFRQFVPGKGPLQEVLPYVQNLSVKLRELNFVLVPGLIVTSLLLLNSIEYTLNQVWQVYDARPITERLAIFCAILILLPLFAISGYYTTTKMEPLISGISGVGARYQDIVPFIIDLLAFVALYYLVPKAPVRLLPAAYGSFIAATLFGLAKHYFAYYIARFTSYEAMYQGIALIPIFLFWLYLSWTIVLFGAEISYQTQHLPRSGKLWKRSLMTVGDGAMVLAMQSLVLIGKAFKRGDPPLNEIALAEQLGCSSVVLKSSLDALQRSGMVMRGDGRDMPLLLARDPESITVSQVREAVFKKRSSMFLGVQMRRMYECFENQGDPDTVTLMQLVDE